MASKDLYYVPDGSKWPIVGSLSVFIFFLNSCGVISELYRASPSLDESLQNAIGHTGFASSHCTMSKRPLAIINSLRTEGQSCTVLPSEE